MGKRSKGQIIQNTVRKALTKLGYKEYQNSSSEKIIELIKTLYPECKPLVELSKNQEKQVVFSKFMEVIKRENLIKLVDNVSFYNKASNILIKLGYIPRNIKMEPTYKIIIGIHPELKMKGSFSKRKCRTVFKHFIQIHSVEDETKKEKEIAKIVRIKEGVEKREEKKKIKQLSEFAIEKRRFYQSSAWRMIRYKVIMQQNGQCQLCGRTRKDGIILHVDHIVPLSKDWSKRLDIDNLQVLCEDCNMGKSNTDCIDWR